MKKKVFKVGDKVKLEPEVYKSDTYSEDYIMTVVEVSDSSKWLRVKNAKASNGFLISGVNGHWKYFKLAVCTDPITGERLNV